MQEEDKSKELEIIEFLHTVVPNETYFVFFGDYSYCGILAYWQFVKVRDNKTYEEWIDRISIVGSVDHSTQFESDCYFTYHWSEVSEFLKLPHVEISRKDRDSINRVLYRYNKDFDY